MNFLFFKTNAKAKSVSGGDLSRPASTPSAQERLAYKPRPQSTFKPPSTIIRDHQMAVPSRDAVAAQGEAKAEFGVADVKVTLDSVIDCVPHELLRPNAAQANMSAQVSLPVHLILPQLGKGRISMSLQDLVSVMPQEIFVSPLPAVADRPVQLPLEKIIPQLPEHFFNSRLDQESLPIDSSFFPTPFGPDPVVRTVTPVAAEPAPASAPIIEPPAKPEVVEAKPVEFVVPAVAAPVAEVEKPVEVAAVTATELEDAIAEETIAPAPVAEEIVATSVVEAPPPVAEAAEAASPVMGESPVAEAPLSPMEQRQFLIDINKCSAEDLTRIPGVGPSLAQRIVAFREEHGQITDINQLRQVPGVGNKTFRRIIGGSSAARGKIGRLVNYLLDAPQDQELTIQEIVRLTAQLPGVQGCIMAMDDGLYVTGHVPPPLDAQTISAFGPQLFRRVSRYVRELQAGRVRRFSLFTDQYPVSMFHAGRIFLVVIHQPNRFSKTLLRRCERIAQEINLMCTERVTV